MDSIVTGYQLCIENGVLLGIQPLPLPCTPYAEDPRVQRPLTRAEQAVLQQQMDHDLYHDQLQYAALTAQLPGAWVEHGPDHLAEAQPPCPPVDPSAPSIAVTVPDEVTDIAEGAFFGCVGLTEVTLPAGLLSIGPRAFAGCRQLHTVRFAPDTRLEFLGSGAFAGTALRSIALPEGPETLPAWTFEGCAALHTVQLPQGLQTVGEGAFLGCARLRQVSLPDSLRTIGSNAFALCPSLTDLTLPEGLTEVDEGFFFTAECALQTLALPASLVRIHPDNFRRSGCGPCAVTVAPGNPVYRVKDGLLYTRWLGKETLLWCPRSRTGMVTVADGTQTIDDNAFAFCQNITGVQLPASVSRIEAGAFRETRFAAIELPKGLHWLGNRAFLNSGLRSIRLPDDLERVPQDAFAGCSLDTPDAAIEYADAGRTLVRCPEDVTGLLILPAGVQQIAEGAFWGCEELTGILLPQGLRSIGPHAFEDCTALCRVELPDSTEEIGEYAFYGCSELHSVLLPRGLKTLGERAFACTALTEAILPSALPAGGCGEAVFDESPLQKISLPATAAGALRRLLAENTTPAQVVLRGERTPGGSFSANGLLYRLEPDGTVTLTHCPRGRKDTVLPRWDTRRVAADAFFCCEEVTRTAFAEGLRTVDTYAFRCCTALENLYLPPTAQPAPAAFTDCPALQTVTLENPDTALTVEQWFPDHPPLTFALPVRALTAEQTEALQQLTGCTVALWEE